MQEIQIQFGGETFSFDAPAATNAAAAPAPETVQEQVAANAPTFAQKVEKRRADGKLAGDSIFTPPASLTKLMEASENRDVTFKIIMSPAMPEEKESAAGNFYFLAHYAVYDGAGNNIVPKHKKVIVPVRDATAEQLAMFNNGTQGVPAKLRVFWNESRLIRGEVVKGVSTETSF